MVSYRGSKEIHADSIVDFINIQPGQKFCDLCCGTGAISRKLVSNGFNPLDITMVDGGPWGLFWSAIGSSTFSLNRFADICDEFDKGPVDWCKDRFNEQLDSDAVYNFVLLQAMAWNGSPIRFSKRNTFSKVTVRPSPAPGLEMLFGRVVEVVAMMVGVDGRMQDARTFVPESNSVLFYDPPYGTEYYQASMRLRDITHPEYYITFSDRLSDKSEQLHLPLRLKGKRTLRVSEFISHVKR